jgi:hypothetical protein
VLALGVPSHDTHRSSSYRRPVWARLEIGRGPPALANGRTGVSSRTRSKPHSLARSRERELLLRRWKPCTVTARAHSYSTPCGFFLRLCLALEDSFWLFCFLACRPSISGWSCEPANGGINARVLLWGIFPLSFLPLFFFVVAKPASGATI